MNKYKAKRILNKLIVNEILTEQEYLSRVDIICNKVKIIFPETNGSKCSKIQEININLPRNVSDNIIKAKLDEANDRLNSIISEFIKEISDFEMESKQKENQDNKVIQLLGNILFWSCLIPLLTLGFFSGKAINKYKFDKKIYEKDCSIKAKSDSLLLLEEIITNKDKELKVYQDSLYLFTHKSNKNAQLPTRAQ